MKNSGKISVMLLMLLMAGGLSLSAQRGMRGMRPDSAGMNRMMQHRQMPLLMGNPDSVKMGGMRHGMMPMQMTRMEQFACPMCMMRQQGMGMRHMDRDMGRQMTGYGRHAMGMRQMGPGIGRQAMGMRQPGMGMRQVAPGVRVMENIPNLTDKQKKDIADLRQKQMDEMKKLRDDTQVKMKSLRESHKAKVMSLLTDDQKKWVEENMPKPPLK